MRIKFITGLIFLMPFLGFSQGEWNNWCFGQYAAMKFIAGSPQGVTGSALIQSAAGTSVTVSDSLGNLLFSCNGWTIWNRNNVVMPNGTGILGGNICSQSVFCVPKADNPDQYYLFTVGQPEPFTPPIVGLRYSLVDMRLNGGFGDIVTGYKNVIISSGDSAVDQISGTRHQNNKDVWVVVRKHGPQPKYLAYLVSDSGINLTPVVSSSMLPVHFTTNNPPAWKTGGDLKISPDGTKLVCSDSLTELCEFNSQTGAVTPKFLFLAFGARGAEFSVDSRFLYLCTAGDQGPQFDNVGWQYNLGFDDSLSFVQSQVELGGGFGSKLQLGPDTKIYCGANPAIDSLHCINNPGLPGLSCNYQRNAVGLAGNQNNQCLVQFLQKYKAYIHYTGQCFPDTTYFSGDIWPPADSIRWNFGEPASGASNTSTLTIPTHLYANPGTYTVTLYVRHNDNRTDTTWKAITIHPTPSPNLGPDRTIVQGDLTTFNAGSCVGCTYQWANLTLGQPNIGTGQTYTTGVAGVYMVSVTSQNGCVGRDTVQLTVTPVNPSSCTGYEYWFAAPAVTNHTVSPSPVSLSDLNSPVSMFFTTDEGPATVTVDQPANPLFTPITCTVNNDSAEVVILTPFLEMIENKPADSLLNYGLRVSSDKRISAAYEIQSPYNAATWSLWGKDALGYSFIVPAQHNYSNYQYCSPPARNSVEVVATEDSTIVTIIPAKDVIGHSAHVPFSILMNRGQTWSGRATSGDATMHLGGTTVTATKPVAVTVTDDALFLPGYDDLAFDVAGDQLVPENLAGKEFIALAMSIPAVKTLLLCYAKEDNTTVIFNDSLSIKILTINQGECAQFAFDNITTSNAFRAASIRSDKPVSVYEFTGNENEFMQPYHSFQASGSIIPPVECRGSKKATISSTPPGSPLWHSWMVYAVAKRAVNDAFTFDPPNFDINVLTPVPGTGGIWGYGMHGISNSDYYYRVKITNDEGRFFIPAYSYAVTSTGQFSKYAYFTDFTALNLGVDRKMCPGDCILLDAGAGWSNYLWSTGDTTSTIMARSAGTYWVSTSETGCQLSDTIVISYYPFTPVNLGSDRSICTGDSTLLNAGVGRPWYLWSTGATSQSIWAKTPGNYWVETSGGHCDVYDTVAVSVTPPPSITTTPLAKTICTGENTNIALSSTVTNTIFHWTASLVSGTVTGFSADSGLVISQTLINNGTTTGVVTYHITPKIGDCAGMPVDYTVTVNVGDPVDISISASGNNVCAGTTIAFTATPVNPGTSPVYQWKVNGVDSGSNAPTFAYLPVNGDVVTCILTSSNVVCNSNNPATSNSITMVVNSFQPVSVVVKPSANPVCASALVIFTATPGNGGSAPSYQWKVNEIPVGTNSPVYTYVPLNNDAVTCSLSSSETCATGNPATSPAVTMIVNPQLPVSVSISASSNPFCPGAAVTFTATPVNGGTNPGYQWKVNGINSGTNSSSFSYIPVNNDSVQCLITSNLSCVTGNPASSAKIIMIGSLAPNVAFSACFDTVTTVNAKPFQLKGGLPIGGTYSGPGVNSSTNMFTPSVAGIGVKTINYSYVNVYDCGASKSKSIVVQPSPGFTCGSNLVDIRDNKVYPTVQIGTQCWMAANLDFGIMISDLTPQTDNCVPEKYTRPASRVPRPAFYQWDELMQYQTTEGAQGLCPPGWHVPTEADWTTLMNFYQGNSRAGRPLQDTIINGFKALRSGVFYLNSSWSFLDFATILWSSTATGQLKAISHGMNLYNFSVSLYPASRANAFPVRCLKD